MDKIRDLIDRVEQAAMRAMRAQRERDEKELEKLFSPNPESVATPWLPVPSE